MKVSIITVTYNSAHTLKDCIHSVSSQSYDNIEHIFVDGNSTDNTVEIIKNHASSSIYISETDKGLYDAMNKGLKLATGDLIGILNSDDMYAYSNVIQDTVDLIADKDALYADLCYVDKANSEIIKRYWKSGPYNRTSFKYGWMPPHPTLFVKKSIYNKFGCFNLNLKSAADYELMLRFLYKQQIKTVYLPKTTVIMREGGVSNQSLTHRIKANKEDRIAWELNKLKMPFFLPFLKPLRKLPQYFQKP